MDSTLTSIALVLQFMMCVCVCVFKGIEGKFSFLNFEKILSLISSLK